MAVDIVFGISIAVCVIFFIAQAARILRTHLMHKTLRKAIEKGQPLAPELIEQFDRAPEPGAADERIGFILIALALAVFAGGAIGANPDDFQAMVAIAMFPLFVGIALLLRLRLAARRGPE